MFVWDTRDTEREECSCVRQREKGGGWMEGEREKLLINYLSQKNFQ